MPTTANGTVWNFHTATLPGLGRVRYSIADAAAGGTNIVAGVLAHGANGSVGSFSGGGGFGTSGFRDWWMDQGYVMIEGEGGTTDSSGVTFNHWGNAMNRAAYRAYVDYVGGILDLGPLFAFGCSMGGLVTKWLATRSDIAADFVGLVSFAAVGTMFVGNYDTVPGDTPTNIGQRSGRYFAPSILNAYGVSTYEELVSAAADHAPENWPAAVWSGKRILEMYADNDIAVPWSPRGSAPLRAIRDGVPAVDRAELHTGITTGHDLSGGTGMHLSVLTDFILGSIPGPVEPIGYITADNVYVALGGALYPASFA